MFPSSLDGLVIMRLSGVAFTRLRKPFPNYETVTEPIIQQRIANTKKRSGTQSSKAESRN